MCDIPKIEDPNLIVGYETSDDAAVYKLDEKTGLIQTLDFFTPIVDNPYDFGQIAAANALSDVYAMGGEPKLAMNIVCFPVNVDLNILKEIMHGGADKVKEAGVILAGGHSIDDNEPKYGLSITGFVDPNAIWKNVGSKPGDVLILTKPIGLGVMTTSLKADMLSLESIQNITKIMTMLNKYAADVFRNYTVNACTDITGFGLFGHMVEMAEGSDVTFEIESSKIPYVEEALKLAEMGMLPGGAYRNQAYVDKHLMVKDHISSAFLDLCYDPQTSGGLLVSVPEDEAESIINELNNVLECNHFGIIGRVLPKSGQHLVLRK